MVLAEFKAWFEGFTEAMDKAPTQKQWARIKERVAEIDGAPVTERIYIDHYRPYWAPYWYSNTIPLTAAGVGVCSTNSVTPFNSQNAMYSLGASEASSIS